MATVHCGLHLKAQPRGAFAEAGCHGAVYSICAGCRGLVLIPCLGASQIGLG